MKEIFLAKSKENIQAAEMLFERQLFNASVNRAYYAAFHAAIAALLHEGVLQMERVSHAATQAMFNSELIQRRKRYPSHLSSYLVDMRGVRDDADYKTKLISQKMASRQLRKAREFVEALRMEIEK